MKDTNNYTDVNLEEMVTKIVKEGNITSAQILQTAMNLLMAAERNVYLENNTNNKANGYFSRDLGTADGNVELKVPRDRNGEFRSAILPPPYQRDVTEREQAIQALLENGYSPNAIKRTLRSLSFHYNPDELARLKQEYLELYKCWQNRQLSEDVIAIFIDAYHSDTCIDNKVRKTALYVVIGIDFNGQKDLFGLYLYNGHETKGFWLQTLNQLIERGLKRPLIVISDNFPGLKESVATLFPKALHQLCFIHMQRNVHRNMSMQDSKSFNQNLKQIRFMDDPEICKTKFVELCQVHQKSYPFFIKSLLSDTDNYFAFKYLATDAQKHFYTTNIVESVNSILESLRTRMGGFFQSEDALYTNVFITINSLKERKWIKGVPKIKANLYNLRQLFAQNYGEVPKA